jgi:hypothetical protein
MRTTRTITASLAAVLGAAALAGPAAAVSSDAQSTSTPSHAGKSLQDLRTPDAKDAGTANVYVPPAELAPDTTPVAPPPTWPTNPQPVGQQGAAVNASSSGFDWDSAGMGAAGAAAAFAIVLAGMAGMRRRRTARPGSVATR